MIARRGLKFPISKELQQIFSALNREDELRIVGGCVRDFLLGRDIADIDLATKHKPEDVVGILKKHNIRSIPTGIKHGTITAVVNKNTYEITTLRQDVQTDGRRAEVEFVDDFFEDAKRRDFTINAMSIDAGGNLHDYFHGCDDLEQRRVKFIGDSKQRIQEDYLRILRFFRFTCFYGDKIDDEAIKTIDSLKANIKGLSSHRIRTEFVKILGCKDNKRLLEILNVMQNHQILDEILSIKAPTLQDVENLLSIGDKVNEEIDVLTKFCSLIYETKDGVGQIISKLDFSNKDKKYITNVINMSSKINLSVSKHEIIRLLYEHDANVLMDALMLNIAVNDNKYESQSLIGLRSFIAQMHLPKFIIDGHDLLKINIQAGEIGGTLETLRDCWIKSDFSLSKEQLIDKLLKKI